MRKQWTYEIIFKKIYNFNQRFCLIFKIVQNLGNKGIVIVIKNLCEHNL